MFSHAEKGDVYNEEKHLSNTVSPYAAEVEEPREEETHRSLKPRQISMIAIGGAIGEYRRGSAEWMDDSVRISPHDM
jgi:amino acid permease